MLQTAEIKMRAAGKAINLKHAKYAKYTFSTI